MRTSLKTLWIIVFLGLAAASLAVANRVRTESSNRVVEVVLDYTGVLDYCEAQGLDVAATLRKFRQLGVTGLAFNENNIERLRRAGRLSYFTGPDFARALRSRAELKPAGVHGLSEVVLDPSHLFLVVYDRQLRRELSGYLALFLGSSPTEAFRSAFAPLPPAQAASPTPSPSPSPSALYSTEATHPKASPALAAASASSSATPSASTTPSETPSETPSPSNSSSPSPSNQGSDGSHPRWRIFPSEDAVRKDIKKTAVTLEVATSEHGLLETSLGFSRSDLQAAQDAGLGIWLRPENRAQFSEHDLRAYFSIMHKLQAHGLIFSGGNNEILGYPDNLKITMECMRANRLLYGNIEVPTVEAAQKGSRTLGVDLADQTVRVMSFSPAAQAKLTPDDLVDKFLLGVRERNIRVLYVRFLATPDPGQSLVATNEAYLQSLSENLRGAGFSCGSSTPFAPTKPHPWQLTLMALAVVAGMLLVDRRLDDRLAPYEQLLLVATPLGVLFLVALGREALVAKLLALLAGLVYPALGLLLILPLLLKLDETSPSPARALAHASWMLTKITALSLGGGLLIAGLLASNAFMLSTDQARGIKLIMVVPPMLVLLAYLRSRPSTGNPVWEVLSTRMAFWHAGAMAILALAGAIYIVRTGNAAPGAASDLEINMRSTLETLLVARPRFKEFALGHPALMVAAVLIWERRGRALLWLPILLVAMAQADVVDTFCHIHTPYLISLLRAFHAWWLGTLFGLLAGLVTLWLGWRGSSTPERRSATPAEV